MQDAFDELELGQTFTFRRTFSEGDVALFCGVTGDYNPYHIDETFVQESRFGRKIIPGLLTASMITHIGGMLGFLATDMSFTFTRAVYVGDTVTCVVTIAAKDERLTLVAGLYLGGADPRNPLASPLFGDLQGLPPLLIQVGTDEILLDDSTALAARAEAAGVEVTLEVWPEMWHVFQGFAAEIPEGQEAIERIGAFVRQVTAHTVAPLR